MTFSEPTDSCHSVRFKYLSGADTTSNMLWWHGNSQQYPPHLTLQRPCALVLRQLSEDRLRWLWNQINLKSLYNSQPIKLTQFQNWFHFAWEWTSVAFKILYYFSFFMRYSSFLYSAAWSLNKFDFLLSEFKIDEMFCLWNCSVKAEQFCVSLY